MQSAMNSSKETPRRRASDRLCCCCTAIKVIRCGRDVGTSRPGTETSGIPFMICLCQNPPCTYVKLARSNRTGEKASVVLLLWFHIVIDSWGGEGRESILKTIVRCVEQKTHPYMLCLPPQKPMVLRKQPPPPRARKRLCSSTRPALASPILRSRGRADGCARTTDSHRCSRTKRAGVLLLGRVALASLLSCLETISWLQMNPPKTQPVYEKILSNI